MAESSPAVRMFQADADLLLATFSSHYGSSTGAPDPDSLKRSEPVAIVLVNREVCSC